MIGKNRTGRMDGVIDGSVFSMIVGNTQYLICCYWLCVIDGHSLRGILVGTIREANEMAINDH